MGQRGSNRRVAGSCLPARRLVGTQPWPLRASRAGPAGETNLALRAPALQARSRERARARAGAGRGESAAPRGSGQPGARSCSRLPAPTDVAMRGRGPFGAWP